MNQLFNKCSLKLAPATGSMEIPFCKGHGAQQG